MTYFNFTIQGPDDDRPEEITGGSAFDFEQALERYTIDDTLTMLDPLTDKAIRQERGYCEC